MAKITVYGIVFALKNLGIWLGQYTAAGIYADKPAFFYALMIYLFVSLPTDLLLLNHMSESMKKKSEPK
jgi:hypothetical protein